MDVLGDMLSALRLSGGVFVDAEFRAPWSVLSHAGPEDCAPFFPVPDHVIAYHFVRAGTLTCQIGDGPSVEVKAGEIVILPLNPPHYLHGPRPWPRPVDVHEVFDRSSPDGMLRLRLGGRGAHTVIYCGYMGAAAPDNMLLPSLPGIMVIDAEHWIVRSIEFAASGLAGHSPEMVGKLAEGLFAEAVRRYVAALPEDGRGWLAGLRDPVVGLALALIHGRYAEAWTLDQLAREAVASKTVLAERFRERIGQPVMHYVAA